MRQIGVPIWPRRGSCLHCPAGHGERMSGPESCPLPEWWSESRFCRSGVRTVGVQLALPIIPSNRQAKEHRNRLFRKPWRALKRAGVRKFVGSRGDAVRSAMILNSIMPAAYRSGRSLSISSISLAAITDFGRVGSSSVVPSRRMNHTLLSSAPKAPSGPAKQAEAMTRSSRSCLTEGQPIYESVAPVHGDVGSPGE